jgi:multisubunit Na+/H+ antiporter MnhF subunit
MLLTAIGFLGFLLPAALYYLVIGPTAGDRLVAGGMALVFALLGLYSLWEAKAPDLKGRPKRSIDDP